MEPTSRTARLVAALYFLERPVRRLQPSVCPTLIVTGNAAATGDRILASEMLFRLGIVCTS